LGPEEDFPLKNWGWRKIGVLINILINILSRSSSFDTKSAGFGHFWSCRYGLKRSLTLDLWELVADAMHKVVDGLGGGVKPFMKAGK
jgi:hypothetical protein